MEEQSSFGAWLKQQRRALDLTQAELASSVGCAVETIKRIEQDVRRPGKQIVTRLLDCLAVPPDDRAAISRFARTRQPALRPPARPLASAEHTAQVPRPPTRLIGRDAELAHVYGQFQRPEVRLITLIGPPGVGKTHLALQVAAELAPLFAGGTAFVDLAPISDALLVPATLLHALGLQEGGGQTPLQQLLAALRDRQRLLVLDNFEQVVAAAPLVAALLAHCPRLAVLVTSRTALHLRGEWRVPLAPLAFPSDARLPPLAAVATAPAVALFVERVQQRRPGFRLSQENVAAVVALCAQLDGLPLAIELAAAWVPHYACPTLLPPLRSPLDIPADTAHDRPPRQQTLARAIGWSYDALGRGARQLFTRLSVFAGGCTIEAAVAVCQGPDEEGLDLHDWLFALADKHLVQQGSGPDGQPRFGMLATIREYAAQVLAASDQAMAVRQRYGAYYLDLAETLEPQLKGQQQVACLDRLEGERANLCAVLTWALEHDAMLALRLAGALWRFWLMRGYFDEGRRWLALALARVAPSPSAPRAKALNGAGVLAHAYGAVAEAHGLLAEALSTYRNLEEPAGMLSSLNNLAIVATSQEQFAQAHDYSSEALEIARVLGDRTSIVHILNTLGTTAEALGNYQAAERWFAEGFSIAIEVGEVQAANIIQHNQATVALALGEYQQAIRISRAILPQARDYGFNHLLAHALLVLGDAYLLQQKYTRAKQYLSENLLLSRTIGATLKVIETLISLGHLAYDERDYVQMQALYLEGLALCRTHGKPATSVACLEGAAAAAAMQHGAARATRLFGAAARAREQIGAPLRRSDATRYRTYTALLATVREQLSPLCFRAAWEAGYHMTLEQATTAALDAG